MTGMLLVVTIDRLPAWIMPAYGGTWVSMPAVDALAARGVVFDAMLATSTDHLATVADLLGGETRPALAAWADAAGAMLVTDDAALARACPGVQAVVVPPPAAATAVDEAATGLARLCDAAAAAVTAGRHRVVWCHVGSLGMAWDAPAEFRDAYVDPEDPPPPAGAMVPAFSVTADTDPDVVMGCRQAFAGQLTLLDRRIGALFDAAGPTATVFFAGVRGMPLGLHGLMGCGELPPFSEVVRLPAILVDGAGRMAGQRFVGLATPADLAATLVELGGGRAAGATAPWHGRSLAGLFVDWSAEPRDRVVVAGPTGVAVVTPAWQLVLPATTADDGARPLLFAKPDDHFELCDVADRCSDVVDELGDVARAAAAGDLPRAWAAGLGSAATTPA
ncbi:MAG: hypothetical protein ACKOC8_12610 [Pirellulales bacterium]